MKSAINTQSQDNRPDEKNRAMEKYRGLLTRIGLTLLAAVIVIAVVTVASVVYGLIADNELTMSYFFIWNFVACGVIIVFGVTAASGVNSGRKRGLDIASRWRFASLFVDADSGTKTSARILLVGLSCMVITGLLQMLVA